MIISKDSVKELTTKFSEPTWLADSRLEAWESYLQRPMPTERDEDWRRTDVASLDLTQLQALNYPGPAKPDAEQAQWFEDAFKHFPHCAGYIYLSTANGVAASVTSEAQQQGVVFCDIATAIEKHADKLRTLLSGSEGSDKFTLLNRALFNAGAFLYVPRNVSFPGPFIFALDLAAKESAAVFPRVIIAAEDNSTVDVMFMLGSPNNVPANAPASLAAALVDVHVKRGARVNYLEVQQFGSNVFYVQRLNSHVDQDGTFDSLSVAVGGRQTKSDIATYLKAPGANSEVLGVVLGSDSAKFSYNTIQEHNAPDTTSDINFRVALKDTSSSVYQGIIRVDKVAQRTAAYQSNKNLLLGGDAKADSIPKLEILADDVKCSHGATVGPVDREQLFYLRSRGLTAVEAEQLVVLGFFNKVLEQSPVTLAVEWLTQVIAEKISENG